MTFNDDNGIEYAMISIDIVGQGDGHLIGLDMTNLRDKSNVNVLLDKEQAMKLCDEIMRKVDSIRE